MEGCALLGIWDWRWVGMRVTEGMFDVYKMIYWAAAHTGNQGVENEWLRREEAFLGQVKASVYMPQSWGQTCTN